MARSRGWFGSVSVLGLVLAMLLAAVVIPTVAATPASANLNGVFPANGDEDLTEQFTSRDALFAYTVSDLSGGRICIIPATEDGSCGDPAWGSPNFVVGIGTVYTLIEGPSLRPGSWRLRTESKVAGGGWQEGSTSEVFTVSPCGPGECLDSLGAEQAQAFKDASAQATAGAVAACAAVGIWDQFSTAKSQLEVGVALAGGDFLTAGVGLAGLAGFSLPDFRSAEQQAIKLLQTISCNVGKMHKDIVEDPPDPDYTVVATAPPVPPASVGSPELRTYADAMAEQEAVGRAALKSYERYQGALAAGDEEFERVQARAIDEMASRLADALGDSALAARALATSTDPANTALTARVSFQDQDQFDQVTAILDRIDESGLTAAESAEVDALGLSPADRADYLARLSLLDTDGLTVQGTVADSLQLAAQKMEAAVSGTDNFARDAANVADGLALPENAPPTAVDDSLVAVSGAATEGNVLANDTDPEGQPLQLAGNSNPAHGTVTCTTSGDCSYVSTAGYQGTDSFTYTVSDGVGTSTGTVNISVAAPPQDLPPTAVDDTLQASSGLDAAVNVLSNDSDPEGASLQVTTTGAPAHGAVACSPEGDCSYRSDAGYQGQDAFSYVVSDGGSTATATVRVTVSLRPEDLPPIAVNDTATVIGGREVLIEVLANDSDPAGGLLTLTTSTTPAHGTASCEPNGRCTYTAALDYAGPDGFDYTVQDTQGQTTTATVAVTVTPADAAPTAVSDSATVVAGVATRIEVLANDTGVTALRVLSATTPAHGTVSCPEGDGGCYYTGLDGYAGPDQFSYTASDDNDRTATATVSVTVRVNHPPVTTDDALRANAGATSQIDVIANDTDQDGQSLTAVNVGPAEHGTASCSANLCSYTPDEGFVGSDQFTYGAQDTDGATTVGIVRVTVVQLDITSSGPLTLIRTSDDLNCNVRHAGDSVGSWYGETACGTFVQAAGILYGPAVVPAGGAATGSSGYTPFTPVSHSIRMGAGTAADPYRVVVTVALGGSGLTLTQTDRYVVGSESYRTDVTLNNPGAAIESVIYRAGDCFLQDSDVGIGQVDAQGPACKARPLSADPDRILGMYPLTGGSGYLEAQYTRVWQTIGDHQLFDSTCECELEGDNGIGLSWPTAVPAGGSATVSHLTVFSPTGTTPVVFGKTADAPTAQAGGTDGYTVTLTNGGATPVTLGSIVDTLPIGFSYAAASSTLAGTAIAEPAIAGRLLTWSGAFTVPPATETAPGTLVLHFGVAISSGTAAGIYSNSVTGSGTGASVVGADSVAPIQVSAVTTNAPPVAVITPSSPAGDEGAGIAVDGSSSTDPEGGMLSFAWDLDNDGAFDDSAVAVTSVTLPIAGSQLIRLRVTDAAGNASVASATVVGRNVNPVVSAGPDAATAQDRVFSGAGSFVDPGADSWSATVDWGAGNGPEPLPLNGFSFVLRHEYATPGNYTVTVRVADAIGAGAGTDTLLVSVPQAPINQPPVAVISPVEPTGAEGSAVQLNGSASTDPEGGTLSYAWDLDNDGAFDDSSAAAASVTLPVAGSRLIALRVTDAAGNTSQASATVLASNVQPVVSVGPDRTTLQDHLLSTTGSFVDPGADSWQATVDWGAGAGPEPLALGGKTFLLTHRYESAGDYRVTVSVTDAIGRSTGSDSLVVTVPPVPENLPPAAALAPATPTGAEGSPIAVTLVATDPEGAALTAVWSWSASPLQPSVPDCAISASSVTGATITCDDNGNVILSVSVSDGSTAVVRTAAVQLSNRPPALGQLTAPTEIQLGQAVSLSVPFSDPGAADTHTCSVLAAGLTVAGTITGSVCSAMVTGLAAGPQNLTVTVADDDGGVAAVSAGVLVRTPVTPPPGCATAAPTMDVTVSADQRSAATRFASPRFSTAGPNELLLAFVSADGPAKPNQKVTGISGGGVSWTLVGRSNATWGTAEIWQAFAPAKLTNTLVTATLAAAFDGSITVAAFKGSATRAGAVATAGGTRGLATVSITPQKCNSILWATGHDWSRAADPAAISGQTIVHKFLDRRVQDSYWTQRVNSLTAGTRPVIVGVTGFNKDRWNMTAVEIPGIG